MFQQNGGPASARNNGVSHARGELVLFVDDDVVPAPQLVAEHIRSHGKSDVDAVVIGPMLNPQGFRMVPWVRWEQARLLEQYTAMIEGHWQPTARQFYTGNSSLPRAHIVAAGGFDERFRRAEDVDLGYRLADRALHFVFNPNAIGYHYADRSFRSWLATPYDYGRSDVVLSLEKGQDWLIERVVEEFQTRHAITRLLVRTCLGRRLHSTIAMGVLRAATRLGVVIGLERVSQWAFSGIFNLRYYQGVADELGSKEDFFDRFS